MQTAKEYRESIEQYCKNGPFGHYDRGAPGHVLNTLVRYYMVPLHVVERLRIGADGNIDSGFDEIFCQYKYFDGIETPLISFTSDKKVNQKCIHDEENGVLVPRFILHLSDDDLPCLIVEGSLATLEMFSFLCSLGEYEHLAGEQRELNIDAGVVLKSGFIQSTDDRYVVEFTKPEGVCAWLDYLNDHFTYAHF